VIEAYKLAHPAPPEPESIQIELVETPVLQEAAN